MRRAILLGTYRLILLVATGVFVFGCSKRVMVAVPPRVDLDAMGTIGLIEFNSNAEGTLPRFASQRFLETIQSSQPGIRVLELGDEALVLKAIGRETFDHEAVRLIREEYGIDALVTGNFEVTDVKPQVSVSSLFSLSAQAEVEASMSAKLFHAASGATVWSSSYRDKATVAHVGAGSGGGFVFGATDPDDAYGVLVNRLVYQLTHDFRVQYVKQ